MIPIISDRMCSTLISCPITAGRPGSGSAQRKDTSQKRSRLKQLFFTGSFRRISGRNSDLFWNISDRVPLLSVPQVFWRTDLAMPLRENMSPYSVSIREARRNGWTRLSRLYARCMPAPWIFLLWSIGNRGGCSTAMNRWRFLCRECRDPITGSCSFQRQREWDTATAPTAGINI